MKRSPIKRKRRATGEAEVFRQIWDTRPHLCEQCGALIREARAVNFAHVIPKSRRPDLRLEPSNIRLLCAPCHMGEHTGGKVVVYL
jgi:5-methylcytosine-specific restriction endonuclease McrA